MYTFTPKFRTMKKHLIIFVLFCTVGSLQAQKPTFWNRVNNLLTKPANVDSTRVYQPTAGFSLGVFSTLQKSGFDVNADFRIDDYMDGLPLEGVSNYSLSEKLCKKVGLEVDYGNFGFGYSLEVGPRSANKRSGIGFSYMGKSFGARINYYKITNPFVTGLTVGNEGDDNFFHYDFSPDEEATLKSLSIDGYYVFNNKRFAYPAAYKRGLVQRRTTGSWLLTARYMQGDLYNSPEAAWDTYNMVDCFATMQASVGGGYSVNFVPWHRDPTGPRDAGLRNLTINLTAMPVLTAFNYLKTISYEYDDAGNKTGETISKAYCYPMPNYIGSAAVSMTFGHIYFSAQFTYNTFYFRSNNAFNAKHLELPDYVDYLSYRGNFYDWLLKGLLVYSF